MKYRIEELIGDYKRKVTSLQTMIEEKKGTPDSCESIQRLTAKKSTFSSVVTDLERLLKESESAES